MFRSAFIVKAVFFYLLISSVSYLYSESFKVGIYQNSPKVYVDEDGAPGGIFVDVLNEIAKRNDWDIIYIQKEWKDLIQMIENDEIDILVDVAYSKNREEIMNFSNIELLRSWLQLYTLKSKNIEHISELKDKKIGILEGSAQEHFFKGKELFEKITFPSYSSSVKALNEKKVDGIIVDRFFYFSDHKNINIVERPLLFKPEGLHFAFSKSLDNSISCKLDKTVADLKNDSGSVFYRSLKRHLQVVRNQKVPTAYYWILLTLLAAFAVFVVFTILLKIQVNRKTLQIQRHLEEMGKIDKLESIGFLAGGIAHDFNNILTGVYGYLEMMQTSQSLDLKSVEYIRKATKSLDRAKALTFQLLTFAKGGAPVVKQEKIETFLDDIVRFSLAGSNCSAVFDIGKDIYDVEVDVNQISQVLENIVINAKQAMPGGGVVKVRVENMNIAKNGHTALEEGKYVVISIKDEGVGIRRDILGKVFDPFFTTKEKGSGIGLAASFSIMKKHGGYIEVESEVEKGSVFRIYLPAVSRQSDNESSAVMPQIEKGEGRVIIMDDDEIVRNILENMLERMNYSVVVCSKGEEALDAYELSLNSGEALKFMIFDLTVSDGMGGLETVKKIREKDMDIPVFVTSGYADSGIIASPEDFGFTDSISKPFRINELSELIKKNGIN